MNLADMLSFADIRQLSRIATTYQCECDGHSKHELIQSILSRMNRKDVFENQINNLSLEDIRFMNTFLFDPREAYSLEELIARVKHTHFADKPKDFNPRDTITKFKQLGWLFNGYSQHSKYLFHFPKDLKRRFSAALLKRLGEHIVRTGEPVVFRDEHQIIAQDIGRFLHFVYHHGVPLTADGTMYKRQIQSILNSFEVNEATVNKGGWRFGYGRKFKEYPNRFSLMYDFCYFHGLVEELEGELNLTEAGVTLVLSGQKPDIRDLYRFWLRLYKNAIPNIQSLVYWIENLSKDWVTFTSLKDALIPLIRPFYYDDPVSILEHRVLRMMMHLGLVRIGGDSEDQGIVVKMTSFGSEVIHGIYVTEEDKVELPD